MPAQKISLQDGGGWGVGAAALGCFPGDLVLGIAVSMSLVIG